MKGTVLVTANIRDGSTANLVVGQVYRGDVMYGEVRLFNGLQRLFYTKVYRAEGNVQAWPEGSNTAVSDGTTQILQLSNEPEPAPDVHVDMTLKSDGTITGTWNDI